MGKLPTIVSTLGTSFGGKLEGQLELYRAYDRLPLNSTLSFMAEAQVNPYDVLPHFPKYQAADRILALLQFNGAVNPPGLASGSSLVAAAMRPVDSRAKQRRRDHPRRRSAQRLGAVGAGHAEILMGMHAAAGQQPSIPRSWLSRAPIQQQFQRPEDLLSWLSQFIQLDNFDYTLKNQRFRSTHRILPLGQLEIAVSDYRTSIRIDAMSEPLMFNFNAGGETMWQAEGYTLQSHKSNQSWIVKGASEGSWIRTPGTGVAISTTPLTVLNTCRAMYGAVAAKRLITKLRQPLQACGLQGGAPGPFSSSLLQTLQLIDGLLSSNGSVPAALALDDLICRQLVLMLMPELQHQAHAQPLEPADQRFEQLLEWIESQLTEPLSLTQLESHSGLARRTLQKAFHARFGCGPMQWLRKRRLQLALAQLSHPAPGESVSAVARRCGYLNLSSFSRDFAERYGRKASDVLRSNQPSP